MGSSSATSRLWVCWDSDPLGPWGTPLWPLPKGCVIHLFQCALQTWLFSMYAMTGQGQTPWPWSQDLNSLHGIQGHTIVPSLWVDLSQFPSCTALFILTGPTILFKTFHFCLPRFALSFLFSLRMPSSSSTQWISYDFLKDRAHAISSMKS